MIGAPFLLAMALRADGWWWRSTNIWHKPNCLPESATDRPTVAHSYVFQFSKSGAPTYWVHRETGQLMSRQPKQEYDEDGSPLWRGRAYFHNAEAVREPAEWARWGDQTVVKEQPGKAWWIQPAAKSDLGERRSWRSGGVEHGAGAFKDAPRTTHPNGRNLHPNGRNLRSVWSIPTQGFPDAHFATWPEALIERIIKMACPEQVCRVCGKPREPIVDAPTYGTLGAEGAARQMGGNSRNQYGGQKKWEQIKNDRQLVGLSDCGCCDCPPVPGRENESCIVHHRPGIILDPFLGSGTTALVARRHGRACVGIELSEEYAKMAAERTRQLSLLAS